jgi:mono/diheme cytochrome c family protein
MHHEYRSMKNRLLKSPLTAAAAVALLAGAAFLPGCGEQNIQTSAYKAQKEKIKADVKAEVLAELGGAAPQGPVESSSSCVSCHTDEERLKMETAGIKQPKGSALTSGKG